MRQQQRQYGSKAVTGSTHLAEMLMQLTTATDVAFAGLTLEWLQQRYNKVPPKTVEYHLTIARQKRAGEAR